MKTVLIIGCGDIGQRIARLYLAGNEDIRVCGLVRREQRAAELTALGISTWLGDLAQPESLQTIPTKDAVVYYLAPPPREGDTDPHIRNFLDAIPADAHPGKIILISTTAVYGDCQGEWITEQQPVHPETARGRRRVDAENTLRAWCDQQKVDYVILRVGGIYGHGRYPLERLSKGLPILKESESPYTNRIHQDDLARICLAAADRGESGEIFNVADGRPGTMSAYFKSVAQAFDLPVPEEIDRESAEKVMTPGMLSYLRESRRIDNRKLIEVLQVQLRYPELSAGLAHSDQ